MRLSRTGIINTVAQLTLVVILMPFAAIILSLFPSGNAPGGFLISLADKIPMFEVWVDTLVKFGSGTTAEAVSSSIIEIYVSSFFEALTVGLIVFIGDCIASALKMNGLKIFQTFVSVLVAAIVINLAKLTGGTTQTILTEIVLVIILFVGLKLIFKSVLKTGKIFSLKKILLIVIDSLFAVIVCGYLTALSYVSCNMFASASQAFSVLFITTAATIAAAVLSWAVSRTAKS